MTRRVEIAPCAEKQVDASDRWWRAHRSAAPDLFVEELASCVELIASMPLVGRRYAATRVPGIRRVLMRGTRYHVYYVVKKTSILIVAVFSGVRGSGPDLRPVR